MIKQKPKCVNCRTKNGERCKRCKDFCQDRKPAHLLPVPYDKVETGAIGIAPRDICSCEDIVIGYLPFTKKND